MVCSISYKINEYATFRAHFREQLARSTCVPPYCLVTFRTRLNRLLRYANISTSVQAVPSLQKSDPGQRKEMSAKRTCIIVGGLFNYDEYKQTCEQRGMEAVLVDPTNIKIDDRSDDPAFKFCQLQSKILLKAAENLENSTATVVVCNVSPQVSRQVYAMYRVKKGMMSLREYNDRVTLAEDAFNKVLDRFDKVVYIAMTNYDGEKLHDSVAAQMAKGSPRMPPDMEAFYSQQYKNAVFREFSKAAENRVAIAVGNTKNLNDTFTALNL